MTDYPDIMSLRGFPPWRVIHTQGDKSMLKRSPSPNARRPDMTAPREVSDEEFATVVCQMLLAPYEDRLRYVRQLERSVIKPAKVIQPARPRLRLIYRQIKTAPGGSLPGVSQCFSRAGPRWLG
jgi:hypothetical protein